MNSLRPGARVQLRVDRLSLGGDGVGRLGAGVVFIPYSCPGDNLEVAITEAHLTYSRARILRVVTASAQRIPPPCPAHFRTEDSVLGTNYPVPSTKLYCGRG